MPKTIQIQITGETERLFHELANLGLTERQVFAKALGLVRIVHKTGRVALLKAGSENIEGLENIIEYIFTLQSSEHRPKEATRAIIRDKSIDLRDKAQTSAEEAIARAEAASAAARARADELAKQLRERVRVIRTVQQGSSESVAQELYEAKQQAVVALQQVEQAADALRRVLGQQE